MGSRDFFKINVSEPSPVSVSPLEGWTSRFTGQGFFVPTPERGRGALFDLTRNLGPVSLKTTLFASSVRHPVYVELAQRYALTNLPEPKTNRGVEFFAAPESWSRQPLDSRRLGPLDGRVFNGGSRLIFWHIGQMTALSRVRSE